MLRYESMDGVCLSQKGPNGALAGSSSCNDDDVDCTRSQVY